MDTPENYYAILGVPVHADIDMIKHAYRQLARRYHPDLAGPGGAVEMKRINRAYDVLSDPEKRHNYDTITGGVIDLRRTGFARVRPQPHMFNEEEDIAFSGLNIFSSKGPFHAGVVIHSALGVVSALRSIPTVDGMMLVAGSLDGKGMVWHITNRTPGTPVPFAADPRFTVESLRELRFSPAGTIIAGWGQLGLHVWDAYNGALLWSYDLRQRAVSAHYSLDTVLQVEPDGKRLARIAFPLLRNDARSPRALGVRGTDIVSHVMGAPDASTIDPLTCIEEGIENRHFWAIRLRALTQNARALVTLSCAHVPDETQEMAIIRRWDLTTRTRLGKARPQIATSVLVGHCADCEPPYAVTPDAAIVAFVYGRGMIRLCDTNAGTYSEVASGTMGGSSKLALSPDGQWLAVAREDSEVNEGVVDLWSVTTGQVIQKLYHPWQISAFYFAERHLVVALTDGTIQIWEK